MQRNFGLEIKGSHLKGLYINFPTGAGEVLIEFVTDNNEANVYIDRRFWKKKEIKDVLKTLKEGDRVQVGGSFTMEGGMTIFSGETLSKK